ncbi:MAG: class I mannose-6-phosphate isomerase [Deltaproteobacteria bacterium]|nr:class I mannose-6-phosphate isomerase [Deltaproteobacteria bacterium]
MLPALLGMRPHYVDKLWGGTRIARLPAKGRAGHAPPVDVRVGESWEVADLPEGSSTVDGGPLHGRTLTEVVARFGRELVGERAPTLNGVLRFPLLVKLIDATDDLSVQVHPGEDYARAHPGSSSKDEAWLVVDAEPGARILHGLVPGVDAAALRSALGAGRVERLLRAVSVAPGDVVRVEPGTMHAVGKGCLLLEVQEPSDTTFRLWDWGRVDHQGRQRPLHVEQAMAVTRFGNESPPTLPPAPPGEPVVRAPRFTMSVQRVEAGARRPLLLPEGSAGVAYVLGGSALLDADAGATELTLPAGASAVVCARARGVSVSSAMGATVIVMAG